MLSGMSYPIFEVDVPVQEGADSGLMNLHVSIPAVEKAAPAIMVFQEAFGVNKHIREILQRLSQLGYVAVAPELFHRTGPRFHADDYSDMHAVQPHTAKITSKGIIVDAQATYNWLMTQPQVDKHRIMAIGFCLGGRAAYLANATLPLRAAVSFYGGHIKDSLLNLVEDLHGDMLFFWGGRDEHVPREDVRRLVDAMRNINKTYTTIEFGSAGHGFFCDARPSYHPRAAAEAWDLLKTFLASRLG